MIRFRRKARTEAAEEINWEAITRQRERELRAVGEARHRAEATIDRVRADAETQRRKTGTTQDRWNLGVHAQACRTLSILDNPTPAPTDTTGEST